MIVSDKNRRAGPMSGFGAFGSNDDAWCDAAAKTWASVTGNAAQAEEYRLKCRAMWVPFIMPNTTVALAGAGLPLHFSTNPDVVRGGLGGKIAAIGKEVVGTVSTVFAPPQAVPAAPPQAVPQNPPSTDPWVPGVIPNLYSTNTPGSLMSKLPLIIGGVGVLGLLALVLLKKKGSFGFAGIKIKRSKISKHAFKKRRRKLKLRRR